ncbi:MAG: glycosyltransferase family 9 protein, partial [Deltaproteobacteria bacterium]|nr:glycosyltransferase family 9 protein [Deltaproteobacteria bacterium]
MRILIINLTRFGDLLQSQAVIHGLRQQGHEIGLICQQNFAPAATLLDGLSHMTPLPGGRLLSGLDAGWPDAVLTLHAWMETLIREFMPEAVLNLTASTAAKLLARRFAGAGKISGFGMDEHGFGVYGSAWTAFFEASTRRRGCSPYNIVDLFLRASGLHAPAMHRLRQPDTAQSTLVGQSLRQEAPACSGHVAFQLGASEARRQWPAEQFAALGVRLWEHFGLMPILLGTPNERDLAERYLAAGGPGIDRVGRTSLPELAAILHQVRLLVSNDTGTLHLAAGLGIPCLALFLATAQPWDTGPYLEGCCSLEPALPCHPCAFGSSCGQDMRCVRHIAAEVVWPLLASYLRDITWTCPPDTAAQARVWVSSRDDRG